MLTEDDLCCRMLQPSQKSGYDDGCMASSASSALSTSIHRPHQVSADATISQSEKMAEDSNRLAAWLARIGLSSRITDFASLLNSVHPTSSTTSSETIPPSGICASSSAVLVKFGSQDLPTCWSAIPQPLPHVGLNTVMSMKRDFSTSPSSCKCRFLSNTAKTLPSALLSSVSECCAPVVGDIQIMSSKVNSLKSPQLLSVANSSSVSSKPAVVSIDTSCPNSVSIPSSVASEKTSCGQFLQTESLSELLNSGTTPSSTVTPCDETVFCSISTATFEANHDSSQSTLSTSSVDYVSSNGRITSTPARRPQSLDVIPWSPLLQSSCTLTTSLSTVTHSCVSSGTSAPLEPAAVDIPVM